MIYKTEDGKDFSSSAYLVVPDPDKPSTWKLRVQEEPGKVTDAQLGAAAAALSSGGFRGNRVELSDPERKAAAKKLIALYHKIDSDDVPDHLYSTAGMTAPNPGKSVGDTLVMFGGALKALGDGRVGGYGITFGGRDITNEFYTPDTYLGPHNGDGADCLFHHSLPMKGVSSEVTDHLFHPVKAIKDELGVMVETVLDLADEYEAKVYAMVKAGKLGWSSGSAAHMVRKTDDGEIKRWPIAEFSFTPTPAEPRNRSVALKTLIEIEDALLTSGSLSIPDYLKAVAALPVVDHAEAVASTVKAFNDRMAERLEFRATKDGRVLSEANLTSIQTVDDHLAKARGHIAELLTRSTKNPDPDPAKLTLPSVDPDALYARYLYHDATTRGVLAS